MKIIAIQKLQNGSCKASLNGTWIQTFAKTEIKALELLFDKLKEKNEKWIQMSDWVEWCTCDTTTPPLEHPQYV